MDYQLRLRELLVERSLRVGDFTLAGGGRSRYYVDARRTTMSAEGQFLVGKVCWRALLESLAGASEPTWVGGPTMGADPVAYAIAHRSWLEERPMDAFSVRKEAKEHGTGRRIEGGLPEGAPAVVVEDTVTTGGSLLDAVEAVEAHGARVAAVLTLVDREEGGRERLAGAGHELLRVFTGSELLEAAEAAGLGPPNGGRGEARK